MGQLNGYCLKDALSDLVSGLTVAFVRIPQGMAYAFLAGVQPQYGLYTGIDITCYMIRTWRVVTQTYNTDFYR